MNEYTQARWNAFGTFLLGILLMVLGVRIALVRAWLLAPVIVGFGVWLAARAFGRMTRAWVVESELRRTLRARLEAEYRRASLPRQIFWLLFAVAEADGPVGAVEREAVRRFLVERMPDPVTTADLERFEAARIPPEQVEPLAMQLRFALGAAQAETLFAWCCLVAFADGRFARDEHAILQGVARGLGLAPAQARTLFQGVKAEVLGQRAARGGPGGQAGPEPPRRGPRGVLRSRAEALAVLGLGASATREQIRTRHRELVKRFHPDANAALGPRALEEATARFREVQAAYEYLSA
ncbi:MAG: TerB family tellurite resistance protein [Planctomycetes bacterium]|nr:TerB family tellurite resistance protein [Planctomycetota bacterium]